MPGVAPGRGEQCILADDQTLAAGTFSSNDVWLREGGGMVVTLDVSDIAGSTLTTLNVQAKTGSAYDTVIQFGSLAITANGRYLFRAEPGAARTGGANAYKGVVEDIPPVQSRLQVVSGGPGTATFDLHVGALHG